VRDRETIESELRLIAAVLCSIREQGGQPTRHADELLDERSLSGKPTNKSERSLGETAVRG
jgi:hypothetical protein